ncbi:MAG: helix-turn-helix transcriptional regulator [Labedaea sp.]
MKDRTSHTVRTRRLCMVLSRLRVDAGLTMSQVAKRIGVSPSTISRAESGKRGISRDDLASLLTIYGASRSVRAAMMELHGEALKPGFLDRGQLQVHEDLEKWIGFEQDATVLYNYEPLLVPGLLQTFPYARAVIQAADLSLSEQVVDDRVAARISRQALLRQPRSPRLDVVLHEAALHQRVGGSDVMREQIGYLIESAGRRGITIRLIPREVGAHSGMNGPFVVMDYARLPSIVHLENKVASLYLDAPGDVQAYKLAWDGLLSVAHAPDRSAEVLRTIAAGLV